MNIRTFVLAITSLAVTACTTTEKMDWVGVGGSKADGNVVLGIDVPEKMGVRETHIEWDVQQANAEAVRRCKNWGYTSAEVFSEKLPVQKLCRPAGISPCWGKSYRVFYQCVGDGTRPAVKPQ